MKNLDIFDMDGTIVCSEHRYKTMPCNTRIDLDFWVENTTPENIMNDSLLPHSNQYFKSLQDVDRMVIIATARTMEKGDANFEFIENCLGMPDHVIHRLDGDIQSGVSLKNSGIVRALSLVELATIETVTIYEDNIDYLQGMTEFFEGMNKIVYPIFVKSNQGH